MNFKQAIISAVAIATLASVAAEAQSYVVPGRPAPYPGPGRPGPAPLPTSQEIQIRRQVIDERLNISNYLADRQVIQSVVVEVRNAANRSMIQLLVDGRSEASSSQMSGSIMLRPYSNVVVDRYRRIGNVEILINGAMFIERIIVNGSGGGGYPSQSFELSAQPNIILRGNSTLDLARLVNLHSYQNHIVESVLIQGRSARGFGTADLITNNRDRRGSINLPVYSSTSVISLNDVVGRDLRALELRTMGDITIERVVIRVRR